MTIIINCTGLFRPDWTYITINYWTYITINLYSMVMVHTDKVAMLTQRDYIFVMESFQ